MNIQNSPYQKFKFKLEIEGTIIAAFDQAIIPTVGSPKDQLQKPRTNQVRTLPSGKPLILTLKRGIMSSAVLFMWYKQALAGDSSAHRNLTLTLSGGRGKLAAKWQFTGAYPSKYAGPTLAAKGDSEVAIEEIVITAESIQET